MGLPAMMCGMVYSHVPRQKINRSRIDTASKNNYVLEADHSAEDSYAVSQKSYGCIDSYILLWLEVNSVS